MIPSEGETETRKLKKKRKRFIFCYVPAGAEVRNSQE